MNERQRQCLEALSLLQRYIDRDLEPSEIAVFEQHLDACRECGLETRVYLDIKNGLADRRGIPDHAASWRLREFAISLRDDE